MRHFLAFAVFCALVSVAHAQGFQCRTATTGSSTKYCASEAFVQGLLTGLASTESKNLVFAGPKTGSAAAPAFRAIDVADLGAITGTVTDNFFFAGATTGAAAAPAFRAIDATDFGAVTGTVTDNTFFAGASTGAAAAPAFRTLATADLNSTRGQYPGTNTNDNASTGNIGEFVSSSLSAGSGTSLSNDTPKDITSVSLTAGDWDCRGNLGYTPSATSTTNVIGWISTTSATQPATPGGGGEFAIQVASGTLSAANQIFAISSIRFSLAGSGTAYLSAQAHTGGTMTGWGFIGCRRMR